MMREKGGAQKSIGVIHACLHLYYNKLSLLFIDLNIYLRNASYSANGIQGLVTLVINIDIYLLGHVIYKVEGIKVNFPFQRDGLFKTKKGKSVEEECTCGSLQYLKIFVNHSCSTNHTISLYEEVFLLVNTMDNFCI